MQHFFYTYSNKDNNNSNTKGETSKKSSLRECFSCFFSLSFSCRNCYCCAVNIVFVINLMYVFCIFTYLCNMHTFVHVCIDCLCILSSINQIVILWWSLILYTASSQAAPLHFFCRVLCYANFILCLPNSSVLWQRIASVLISIY